MAPPLPPKKSRQRNKFKELEKTKHSLMQKCINVMQAPSNISSLPPEENTFGRFVAHKLMSFDGYRKMMAKKNITQLLLILNTP